MGVIVFGGSFNPIHIGHLRMAIETREILSRVVHVVDFVPTATPPHKNPGALLPFALRCRMLKAALSGLPDMRCNELESQRSGPSYTFDTLSAYRVSCSRDELYFLLGSQDYALLPEWRNGLELPRLANLLVVPRGPFSRVDFVSLTAQLWKGASSDSRALEILSGPPANSECLRLENGGKIYYLPLSWLDISASAIRQTWLAGRSIKYLVADATLDILDMERSLALAHWRGL